MLVLIDFLESRWFILVFPWLYSNAPINIWFPFLRCLMSRFHYKKVSVVHARDHLLRFVWNAIVIFLQRNSHHAWIMFQLQCFHLLPFSILIYSLGPPETKSKDSTAAEMVSRRKILSRSRDDLNLETFVQDEEDVWYQKEKLFRVSL